MAFKLIGDSTGNVAEVDSAKQLKVALPTTPATAGYTAIAAGTKALTTFGPMGRLATGLQTLEMFDPIDGTAVNTNIWNTPTVTTYSVVQNTTTGFLVINNAASTAVNAQAQINSIKRIQLINTFVPTARILFKTPNTPQSNATMELGFGTATGTAAPTEGAFIRWSSASEFRCVTVFNSVEFQSAPLTAPSINVTHTLHITFRGTKVEFFIDEALVAEVAAGAGNSSPSSSSRIPIFARVYSGAVSPVVAPELHIAAVALWRNDLNTNKLWPTQMSSIGRGSWQSPVTPFGQTANHANSTSPVSAALSNVAAGYTTLGGRFQFAAPVGAATDYALFAFQVPADYQFVVTGIGIDSVNIGAAVATTATVLTWSVGVNSSAISLATIDSFGTTWAPRRIPVGMQSWVVGAAIGAPAEAIDLNFDTPLTVDGNRFFHVIVQVPVGTATVGQLILGTVTVNGYFE